MRKSKTMKISGEDYSMSLVKKRFEMLKSSNLQYVHMQISKSTSDIKNIKAYMIKNYKNMEGELCMGLNEENKDTAYVLGRLFSVLESIQMDANPGIKSTIRDRYFNSACATPASVFPVLIKLKNSHIKKLEREKESSRIYYEKLLTEIMDKLEIYPKRLSLEEQGKFILGYYHQMQKKYEKREEK